MDSPTSSFVESPIEEVEIEEDKEIEEETDYDTFTLDPIEEDEEKEPADGADDSNIDDEIKLRETPIPTIPFPSLTPLVLQTITC